MAKDRNLENLRKQAEEKLKLKTDFLDMLYEGDKGKLIHELQVRQIELEVQNEELKRAHEAIEESKTRYADLYDFSPIGYCTLDSNGVIVEANMTLARLLGIDRGSLIGETFNIFIDPGSRDTFNKFITGMNEELTGDLCELLLHGKLGQKFYGRLQGITLTNKQDGSTLHRIVLSDITERKKLEDKLKESTERYSSFVKNFQGIAFRAPLNFNALFFHGSVESITGYSEGDFIAGKPRWREIVYPEDLPHITESINKVSQIPDFADEREYRIICKNGEVRWIHEYIKNITDFSGKPAFIEGAIYDITERKNAEKSRDYEQDKTLNILNSMEDGIYIVNQLYEIEYINPALMHEFGPVESRKCYEYFNDRKKPCPWCSNHEIIKGNVVRWQWSSSKKSKTYDILDAPIQNPDGSLSKIVIFRDITVLKEKEQQQELTGQILELLNRPEKKAKIIKDILLKIKEFYNLDAIGIRIREKDDYPYLTTSGFPEKFLADEKYLCRKDSIGRTLPDADGHSSLECMCGMVICGNVDSTLPYFTESGSFWTNSTTDLLKATSDMEKQFVIRSSCNNAGYESVTLIPLRSGTTIMGLLQCNYKMKNKFTSESIPFLERLGRLIGVGLMRIEAEEKLQLSEDRYALAQKVANIGSWDWNIETGVLHWSSNIEPILGFKEGAFKKTYKAFLESVHPEDRQAVIDSINSCIEKGNTYSIEHRIIQPDGRERWILENGDVIRNTEDKAVRMLGIAQDITDRKLAQIALKKSEEEYRGLVDNTVVGVSKSNIAGDLLYVNQALATIMEFSSAEEMTREGALIRYKNPRDRNKILKVLRKHGKVSNYEVEAITHRGKTKSVLLGAIISDGEISATVVDISKRKRAERKLRDANNKLQEILKEETARHSDTQEILSKEILERIKIEEALEKRKEALEAIYAVATVFQTSIESMFEQFAIVITQIIDASSVSIVRIKDNDPVEEVTYFSENGDVLQRPICSLCELCERVCKDKKVHRFNDSKSEDFSRRKCITHDVSSSMFIVPILIQKGKIVGIICVKDRVDKTFDESDIQLVEIFSRYIAHEISRDLMENKVRRSQEMKMLGQLTSGVAHEVRNPLNGIMAITEALFQTIGDNPEYAEYRKHIRNQVSRLSNLMEELLALGKPVSHKNRNLIHVSPLLQSAFNTWKQTIPHNKNIKASLKISPLLEKVLFRVDQTKIQQVIINILENSLQHIQENGQIILSASPSDNNRLIFQIIDDGKGIPKDNLGRVFDPFFTSRKSGTGLGLSIVKKYVQSHKGTISLKNNSPKSGLTVEVVLPLESG